jgi:hypothetical protein
MYQREKTMNALHRHAHHGIIALSMIFLLLLAACGTPSQADASTSNQTTATSTSLETVDWANFTYSTNCYQNTQPFHVEHGKAVNNFVHFSVSRPDYGDLTGDGQLEAIVPYQCSAADSMGAHVFIYSGNAAHPRLLGDLPPNNTKGVIANVTSISINNGVLHLAGDGYSVSAPHCCPDLLIKTDYRWNGKAFVAELFQVTPR